MGNHMGPFVWASDRSEGQEQGSGTVGGQGHLQGVKLLIWFWTCWRLDFGVKPHVFWHGESVKPNVLWHVKSLWCSILRLTFFNSSRKTLSKVTSEISHAKEHLVWLAIQVCGMFRTKVTISLLLLGLLLLQPLQPVLGLQMGLRLLKINPNDSPYPKNGLPWFPMPKYMWFDTKIKSLACSEPK